MKLVIQKVSSASVEVEGSCVGKLEKAFWFLWESEKKIPGK